MKTLDDALDQGPEDTFPRSDPVSVTQPPSSPHDKHKAKAGRPHRRLAAAARYSNILNLLAFFK
jgi:hypothetical protein